MPEYDDIIFQTPREVSTFYDLLEGPKIAAETNILSVGEKLMRPSAVYSENLQLLSLATRTP